MTCPYVEYRQEHESQAFDESRAYCTAAGTFVHPLRADICNDRYAFDHAEDCEIYHEHASKDGRPQ